MDVHVVHSGSKSRCLPRKKKSISTLSLRHYTKQVPDRVEGQISASGLHVQWNSQLRHVSQDVCERDTPNARLRQNPRPWTNAWFDHVQRTQEIFDEPHNQRTWQQLRVSSLGQIQKIHQIAARATTFSEFALLFTGAGRPGGATSDDDETGSEVSTTCEEEEASGHDFAHCGGFVIFQHFLHRSLSLFAFLPLPPLPPGFDSEPSCGNLHLTPRAQVPLACCLQGIVALYTPL